MLALCVGISYADPVGSLLITDGTNYIRVTDQGVCTAFGAATCVGDASGAPGSVILLGTVGAWTLNNVTGTFVRVGNIQSFDLNSVNVTATSGATLDVYYQSNGVTGTGGGYTAQLLANNINITTAFSGYFNNADTAFGVPIVLGSNFFNLGPITNGFLTTSGTLVTDGSYSLTEQFHLVAGAGGGSTSLDGRINIPEPASMSIIGAGLIGLAGLFRRKLAK